MTVTRYDLKTSEATSEDWGAHSHSRVFRTSDDTDSKTALEIRDLIVGSTGYGGIIAKTGGRLMVDSVIQGDPARVRTVQVRLVA